MTSHSSDSHSPAAPARMLIELDPAECAALLGSASVGRLAVSTDEGPEIFTVNYGFLEGAIAIWTAPGRKLEHAAFDRVAFEVDELDPATHTGWVVEAQGHAEDITEALDPWAVRLRSLVIHPWVAGPHPNCIAILRARLTGRRLVPVAPA